MESPTIIGLALDVARRPRKADGGPFNTPTHRRSPKIHTGAIHSAVAGRTDHLPMHVPSDAYVLPADVVSALGEGNTAAGFKVVKSLFSAPSRTGGTPYGERGMPYGAASPDKAKGGAASGVPIVAAGGEHVLSPDEVFQVSQRFGGGSHEHGHRILDAFVKRVRAGNIKTLQKLPGPKRD